MAVSAEPSVAQVGDSVELRYTVSNPCAIPLVDLQDAAALPNGLTFVSASNAGAIRPASGYIAWPCKHTDSPHSLRPALMTRDPTQPMSSLHLAISHAAEHSTTFEGQ
jgi:uncharacterized repeat protein (TIGR01451 family)